jgi:hypothetical protein
MLMCRTGVAADADLRVDLGGEHRTRLTAGGTPRVAFNNFADRQDFGLSRIDDALTRLDQLGAYAVTQST